LLPLIAVLRLLQLNALVMATVVPVVGIEGSAGILVLHRRLAVRGRCAIGLLLIDALLVSSPLLVRVIVVLAVRHPAGTVEGLEATPSAAARADATEDDEDDEDEESDDAGQNPSPPEVPVALGIAAASGVVVAVTARVVAR
jgi:hypothetical protein